MAKKKLQIFISSTYIDLKEERQAAVEAILGSRHIPAGMELFKAGNTSQLETIKKWINESDLYMLILGGRYGSIEPILGKSYTQIEYEYALEKGIPVFAVVLDDSFLYRKAADKSYEVFEKDNKEKYNEFKEFVMTKIIKIVDDCKDIQIAIKDSIVELENDYPLCGWVRASEIEDSTKIIKENNRLLKENEKLKNQFAKIKEQDKLSKFGYEEIKRVLKKKTIKISGEYFDDKKDFNATYLEFFILYKNAFVTGITNRVGVSDFQSHIYHKICPLLISFGLLEINKVTGAVYRRIEMSKAGLEFMARLEIENNK
ncbi:DUF4062 domain-containing protein [Clostridium uliginosum]|uniref:DUF4062 domain-containing protein n=1 Tax=Clostridium uliginosum TaxID=119641 RepID=A0A1I1GXV5_9CLOT|nr:DUF4062 domain-containing protein [Clostridium uliginosum]SFC14688.1 protein of unknown function [Clostridium uliginosum]